MELILVWAVTWALINSVRHLAVDTITSFRAPANSLTPPRPRGGGTPATTSPSSGSAPASSGGSAPAGSSTARPGAAHRASRGLAGGLSGLAQSMKNGWNEGWAQATGTPNPPPAGNSPTVAGSPTAPTRIPTGQGNPATPPRPGQQPGTPAAPQPATGQPTTVPPSGTTPARTGPPSQGPVGRACGRPTCVYGVIVGTRQWPGSPTSSKTSDLCCDRCGWLSTHMTGKSFDELHPTPTPAPAPTRAPAPPTPAPAPPEPTPTPAPPAPAERGEPAGAQPGTTDPDVIDMKTSLACTRCGRGVIGEDGRCRRCQQPFDRGAPTPDAGAGDAPTMTPPEPVPAPEPEKASTPEPEKTPSTPDVGAEGNGESLAEVVPLRPQFAEFAQSRPEGETVPEHTNAEIANIEQTRLFYEALALACDSDVQQVELALGNLAELELDQETLTNFQSTQEDARRAAMRCRVVVAVLNSQHSGVESAVHETPEAAKIQFYEPV